MPVSSNDIYSGCIIMIAILLIGLVSALGYGIYIVIKNPVPALTFIGLLIVACIINVLYKWISKKI